MEIDTEHPSTKQYTILNGVSTLEDNVEYVIRIKDKNNEDGIFGTCSNKSDAIAIVERVGKDELKILRKTTDKVWTVTDSKFDENKMTYTVTYQNLGRIKNGPIKVYSHVYIEEVPRVFKSIYSPDLSVDGPDASLEEELKADPKTCKDGLE